MRKRISPENRSGNITRGVQQIGHRQPLIMILFVLSLCFFWGCDNTQKKDTKPPENKKIAVETTPSAAPPQKPPVAKSDIAVAVAPPETVVQSDSLDELGDGAENRIYDPTGRIDPFAPLYRTDQDQKPPPDRKKILTPLEKLGINQLKLVAIVRSAAGNTALVEDGTGKGYPVKTGIPIGLNSGIVTEITQNSVIIREETESLIGEPVVQNIEMKLQKPAGE